MPSPISQYLEFVAHGNVDFTHAHAARACIETRRYCFHVSIPSLRKPVSTVSNIWYQYRTTPSFQTSLLFLQLLLCTKNKFLATSTLMSLLMKAGLSLNVFWPGISKPLLRVDSAHVQEVWSVHFLFLLV